jgi:hypothetical protein
MTGCHWACISRCFKWTRCFWNIMKHSDTVTFQKNWVLSPVAYRWGGGLNSPHPRNCEVLTKLSRIPSSVEYTSITTWSEYGFHSFANWVEPLSTGLLPPVPRSHCSLSSPEFVEKNSWVRHCLSHVAVRTFNIAVRSLFRYLGCSTLWHTQQEHTSCMSSGREPDPEPTTRREPKVCSECTGLLAVRLGHYVKSTGTPCLMQSSNIHPRIRPY